MESKKIATNKKAFRNYVILDRFECGIELKGGEVKSVRDGGVSFTDSYARIENGEVTLFNLHITPYAQASYMNLKADRPRKLLLHKREIRKIFNLTTQKQLVFVPTKIYINSRGLVKIEMALGKGKRLYDKREDIKKRDVDLDIKRAVGSRQRRKS